MSSFKQDIRELSKLGTRISASAQCETGGKNIKVWLEIQEI